MTLRVAALDESHDLTTFTSGVAPLDEWLRRHARQATRQGARTYVVVDEDDDAIVGYFAIVPHLLDRENVPGKIARGARRQIPAILLAKLVLSQNVQRQGLGAELLVRALHTILEAARTAGGKLLVVDAIDDRAAAFYRHHDLVALPARSERLVMKMSTVAKALGVSWP